jgi:hypothetical protein
MCRVLFLYFCMLAISSCMKIKFPIYTTITYTYHEWIGGHSTWEIYTYTTQRGIIHTTSIDRVNINMKYLGTLISLNMTVLTMPDEKSYLKNLFFYLMIKLKKRWAQLSSYGHAVANFLTTWVASTLSSI